MYNFLENAKYVVLDVETDGLDFNKDDLVSIAFYSNGKSKFIPIHHPQANNVPSEAIEQIKQIIDKATVIVGHNIKFDLKFLTSNGIDNWLDKHIWDTGIAEYMLTGQTAKFSKLKDLAQKYSKGDISNEKIDLELSDTKASEYPLHVLEEYNIRDVKVTDNIFKHQLKQLKNNKKLLNLIFIVSNFTKTLADIEYNGFKIDKDLLIKKRDELKEEINKLEEKMKAICGYDFINFASNEQLSAVLFGGTVYIIDKTNLKFKKLKSGKLKMTVSKGKIPVVLEGLGFSTKHSQKTKTGYWSVNDETIKKLKGKTKKQKEFIETYKTWNKLSSLYEKYFDKYLQYITEDGYIHAHFNQTATSTGRLSCNKPNIQQIPRPEFEKYNLKDIFISRYSNGYLVEVDFSQLEWRVCAYLCSDKTMKDEIKQRIDAHKQNASLAFSIPVEQVTKEQRQIAKMVSFGLIYGQTAYGLSKRADIPINSEEEAQKIINSVYEKYKNLKKWHDKLYTQAINNKKIVNVSGRFFIYNTPERQVTQIKNYPVQSFATADIAPLVFWLAWQRIKKAGLKAVPVNTVHDCLIFDCYNKTIAKKVASIILDSMKKTGKYLKYFLDINFDVPLTGEVDIGTCWGKMEEIDIEN